MSPLLAERTGHAPFSNVINPFQSNVPFLFPLKTLENQRFLIFPGGIKMEHWHEVD